MVLIWVLLQKRIFNRMSIMFEQIHFVEENTYMLTGINVLKYRFNGTRNFSVKSTKCLRRILFKTQSGGYPLTDASVSILTNSRSLDITDFLLDVTPFYGL